MLPRNFFDKNGAIWGVPKYAITNLKINNFNEKNQQENFHKHVSMKTSTFRMYQGGIWGASPSEAEEIFKKSNKMEAFPYFFCFLARPPISPKL